MFAFLPSVGSAGLDRGWHEQWSELGEWGGGAAGIQGKMDLMYSDDDRKVYCLVCKLLENVLLFYPSCSVLSSATFCC